MRYLSEARRVVASAPMGHSLYGGYPGVAWAMAHLKEFLDEGRIGSPAAADVALKDLLGAGRADWRGNHDVITGLTGIGVYAQERLPAPAALSRASLSASAVASGSCARTVSFTCW